MSIAALITWILAAGVGLFMLIRWATSGGVRKVEGAGTHFLPARVFTHFGLAAAGLILWIVYLVTDNHLLAWIAFVDLLLIALLGYCLSEYGPRTAAPRWPAPRPKSILPSSTFRARLWCYTESLLSALSFWCSSPH